jgi:hypothetical protein
MRGLVVRTLVVVLLVGAAAIFYVLHQTGAFKPSVHDQLKKLAKGSQPAWYLGEALGDLKLTRAATGKARRIAAFGYGSCHRVGSRWNPFGLTSCGYPLLVQTWRLDAGTPLRTEFVPALADGTCARTTLRGVPAAVGTDGVVLYTGSEAIGVLGPPDLVGRAVRALRPAGRSEPTALPAPSTQPRATLADCAPAANPFEPLTARLARLLRASGLPLVGAGAWFEDGQLTSAERAGKGVSIDYESCGLGAALGSCANVLSVSIEPVDRPTVASDLHGAKCRRFTLGGAPGVIWNNQLASGDAAGLYLFTGTATVATARDFTLEHVGAGRLNRAVRALRPLEAKTLPKPTFDAAALVGLCAKTS